MKARALEAAEVALVDSDSWCTDRDTARMLGHFSTDPCSNSRSHIRADRTWALERGEDGLRAPWGWSVYCNPPYSDPLPWAIRLAAHEGPWVALVKLDPTTMWYRTLKLACTGDAPFRHRLKFERPDKPPLTANFPSLLIWRWWTPSADLASHLWLPTYAQPATLERT
jgi:hypothetical protein